MSYFLCFWTKCWSYSLEGLLSKGPTPSSLLLQNIYLATKWIFYRILNPHCCKGWQCGGALHCLCLHWMQLIVLTPPPGKSTYLPNPHFTLTYVLKQSCNLKNCYWYVLGGNIMSKFKLPILNNVCIGLLNIFQEQTCLLREQTWEVGKVKAFTLEDSLLALRSTTPLDWGCILQYLPSLVMLQIQIQYSISKGQYYSYKG